MTLCAHQHNTAVSFHYSVNIFVINRCSKPTELLLNLGCLVGIEPTTLGTTIRYSNHLSYRHHITHFIPNGQTWWAFCSKAEHRRPDVLNFLKITARIIKFWA